MLQLTFEAEEFQMIIPTLHNLVGTGQKKISSKLKYNFNDDSSNDRHNYR